ncbi:hypothetical protein ACFQPF_08340 [Fictibacillus iocasae]|uniref:Hydrolase n=1 Tax=Fictibacillus iocasae TaxID=2715437 RepID=A0ABW2NR25_9BACL
MEKQPYYVNVESGEIHSDKSAASFQFEISATADEVRKLAKMFEEVDVAATDTFLRSHVPYVQYHDDEDNDRYDHKLREVYQMIHDLGQPVTRSHIESMNILENRDK